MMVFDDQLMETWFGEIEAPMRVANRKAEDPKVIMKFLHLFRLR
jgi:hypothetical protein